MRTSRMAMLALVLSPVLALASEDCATQLGGKCRAACAPDERSEQGAFLDCTEKEKCCVPGQARGGASASSPVVVIHDMAFAPELMKVKVGTEVVWRNDDGSAHTVTADDGSFASPPLNQGGVFKKVFTKPGTYSYTCEMHPFMTGKIVVD
jgi:plastocyanin